MEILKKEEPRKDRERLRKHLDKIMEKARDIQEERENLIADIQEKAILSRIEQFQERLYFLEGIAFGLFYGIIGNILSTHYYQLFEGLILWKFDLLYWPNLTVFMVTLALVILVSLIFYFRLKKLKTKRQKEIKKFNVMLIERMDRLGQDMDRLIIEYDDISEKYLKEIGHK